MKKFCLNNITSLIIILVFVIYGVFASTMVWKKVVEPKQENRNILYDLCYDQKYNKGISDRSDFYNYMVNEYKFESDEDLNRFWYNPDYECETIMNAGKKFSAVYLYNSVMDSKYMRYFLFLAVPLLVILAVAYDIFKIYKDKDTIKDLKKDYKNGITKVLLKVYKPVLSVFISMLILFIICIIFTGKIYSPVGFSEEIVSSICNIGSFLIYILTIAFVLGVYVNLTLTVSIINDSFITCAVETFILYIVLWLGLFVPIYNYLLSGEFLIGMIYHPYVISSLNNYPFVLMLIMLLFYLISFAFVYILLINKKMVENKDK